MTGIKRGIDRFDLIGRYMKFPLQTGHVAVNAAQVKTLTVSRASHIKHVPDQSARRDMYPGPKVHSKVAYVPKRNRPPHRDLHILSRLYRLNGKA